ITCFLLLRLVLVRRELAAWGDLLILQWILLSKSARLLGGPSGLQTGRALDALIVLVQLACGCSYLCLRSTIGLPVVRPAQQNVDPVHGRAVNELPLVVRLLLVVNADGRVLVLAGNTDNGSASQRLPAHSGVSEDGVIAPGLTGDAGVLPPAQVAA